MNPRKNILYVPIDFIGNDERAKKFAGEYSDNLLMAKNQIEKQNLPLSLSLKTTIISKDKYGWGVTEVGENYFQKGLKKLSKSAIDYHVETWPSGPTRSMYGVLFDQGAIAAGFQAIATSDLDQFPPHKNLEKIFELSDKTKTTKSVLGSGSRNIPVVLAYNSENKNLRRIMEAFYNLTAQQIALENKNSISLPFAKGPKDPAYNFHGDLITGVYLFNPDHKKSKEFVSECVNTAREQGFFGFEDEYFMALNAAKFGNLNSIYFNTEKNSFEPTNINEEKNTIIKKQIKAPLEKLAKTGISPQIIKSIKSSDNQAFLFNHYPQEQINEVSKYMLEALSIKK